MSGRFLYKYVSFDSGYLVLDINTKNKIKFSEPSRFNDPFDCNPVYRETKSPTKARPDFFRRVEWAGLPPAKRLQANQKAINRVNFAFRDGRIQEQTLSAVGILSLTRTPWSTLMWSHYAAHHTGFVVEFQEPEVFQVGQDGTDPKWLVTFPVEYVKERPVIDVWERASPESIDRLFVYKSDEWRYEEEERVVRYQGGAGVFAFEPSLIKSVIAGCRISDDDFQRLRSAVQEANRGRSDAIKIYRAQLDSKKYQLNIRDFHRPRPVVSACPISECDCRSAHHPSP
ncbi:DUF2971 domain-containing protein [Pseudomonas sp. DY-1]|nr:DUF2971 domain-containing protein [Pseudomonas sp. DY-1]